MMKRCCPLTQTARIIGAERQSANYIIFLCLWVRAENVAIWQNCVRSGLILGKVRLAEHASQALAVSTRLPVARAMHTNSYIQMPEIQSDQTFGLMSGLIFATRARSTSSAANPESRYMNQKPIASHLIEAGCPVVGSYFCTGANQ